MQTYFMQKPPEKLRDTERKKLNPFTWDAHYLLDEEKYIKER